MSESLVLLAVVLAVLYGLWLLLDFTFDQIDAYWQDRRTERRRGAVKPARGERDS